MNRVQPTGPWQHDLDSATGRWPQRNVAIAGLIYLWSAMAIGAYYLVLLSRSFANDLWWPNYNTTGYQLFLVDAINHALEQRLSGVVDLTQLVIFKSYAATQLPAPHPTYARTLLLAELTSLEYAIQNIRNMTAGQSMMLPTHFCYVDFGQRWELAHTVVRQARCKQHYRFNGAVYLDAVVRNVQWARLMDAYSDNLNEAVFAALTETGSDGDAWLTATANTNLSLADEATYWRSFGVTHFQLQWQNNALTGLQSTMTVVNALGIATTIELQRSTYARGPWTSNIFNVFFMNEIFFAATCDQSLVRHSTNYIMKTQCIYSATPGFEGFLGLSDSSGRFVKQTGLVRDAIGPFLSVDLFVLPPPTALVEAIASFQRVLYRAVQTNATVARDYEQLPALSALPLPPTTWGVDKYLFYGGNPMCLNGIGRSYVQSAFSFGDACNQPSPSTMAAQPSALLFALSLSGPGVAPTDVCVSVVSGSDDCIRHVTKAIELTTSLSLVNETLSSSLTAEISDMQVSLMQFASDENGSEWTLLTAPVLHDTDPLGWVYAYDWATGFREVVSFEGDNGTLVLISDAYQSTETQDPNTAPLSQASTIVFYMLLYSSAVLFAIAIACTVLAVRARLAFAGQNLFVFHRVAASTWLGRPVMFLRGGCALLLLSTAPVTLARTNGVSALANSGRPIYEAIVLAGEANWITYVMYECQLVFHPDGSMGAAAVIWCIYSLLDVLAPVTVTTTLERICYSTDFFYTLTCTNGSISIGSLQRLYLLIGIQAAGLLIAILWRHHRTRVDSRRPITVLFSGVANALLYHELDAIGYVLTGLIPLQPGRVFFDVKLWVTVHVAQAPVAPVTIAAGPVHLPSSSWCGRLAAVAGFVYVAAAVSSSYSYLQIAKRTLVNDLIWPGFNLSSTHVFLTTCFWGRIAMNQTDGDFMLTDPSINAIGSTDSPITSSPTHFGARMQYSALTTLVDAVHGLRATNPCDAPWIFTPYCYLDFGGVWDMAVTAKRQARCRRTMATNAAVYLESLLRNVEWDDWVACWGPSFDSAFGNYLKTTSQGQLFLSSVSQSRIFVADEVAYWQRYGLQSYELQWQNFKVIGLDNTYSIANALGLSYRFTLQRSQGHFRLEFQTTYKLYWSLANDLANLPNQTSLLRASPAFAYANASLEDVYVANATFLTAPLPAGYAVIRAALGPFGAIDAKYVEVPPVVRAVARDIMSAVATHRTKSEKLQATYATLPVNFLSLLVPAPWLKLDFNSLGGSLLCSDLIMASSSPISMGLLRLFLFESKCVGGALSSTFTSSPDGWVFAALLMRLASNSSACAQVPNAVAQCEAAVTAVTQWTSTMAPLNVPFQSAAIEALAALNISLMQYGLRHAAAPLALFTTPILDESFSFFGSMFVLEWLRGQRDVVRFSGDHGSLTLLSDLVIRTVEPVQAAELPTVFALYAHATVQYITYVMTGLATVAGVYIVVSRGRVEGLNMLELSRVGGIVWVGRPLLVVRSFSALCLLSTATTLSLHYPSPYLVSFATEASSALTTCLAASEVTWLVGILNDIGLAITREHSTRYTTINSLLVWTIAACLTTLQPVQHGANMAFRCVPTILDFQVTCSTGSIAIGFLDRVLLLIAVIVGCNGVCYCLVRTMWPVSASLRRSQSLLLTAGAKYLFTHDGWLLGDVYYMDRASALLSGLVTVSVHGSLALFDVKTWRLQPMYSKKLATELVLPPRFETALPLPDTPIGHLA